MPRFEAQVEVTHRPGILDPAGATVERALPALGWANVSQVRIGKSIRLVVEAPDEAAATAQVDEMCTRILTNPVIEDYTLTLQELTRGMSATVGVVLFPGTNCEQDVVWAVERLGAEARIVLAR